MAFKFLEDAVQAILNRLSNTERRLTTAEARLVPTGVVETFAGSVAPAGYLLCNGQAVSRTEYAALYGVIGTTYGAGDGINTFNVPPHPGRSQVGLDLTQPEFNALGKTGGAKTHTLTVNEMPSHRHETYGAQTGENKTFTNTGNVWQKFLDNTQYTPGADHTMTATGGGQAHNNLPPYIVFNFIIKT